MNNKKRESLKEAVAMLDRTTLMVETVCNKEQDCVDNFPENLQCSERVEKMEYAIDNLNDAIEKIEDAKDLIRHVIN